MREVDCGRKGIFSLLTARRLEFPQKETLTLTLIQRDDEGPHQSITRKENSRAVYPSCTLEVSIRSQRERETKALFLIC